MLVEAKLAVDAEAGVVDEYLIPVRLGFKPGDHTLEVFAPGEIGRNDLRLHLVLAGAFRGYLRQPRFIAPGKEDVETAGGELEGQSPTDTGRGPCDDDPLRVRGHCTFGS